MPSLIHGAVALVALSLALDSCNKPKTVASDGPVLRVSPAALTFHAFVGAGPAQQQVVVSNAGTDNFTFTATKTKGWLSLIPTADTAPAQLLVQPSLSALPLGVYRDTITVTAPGAVASPQKIPVLFTVGDSLATSVTSVRVQALQHDNNVSRMINISSTAHSALPVSITKQTAWLSLSVTSGTTPFDLTLTIDPSALTLGSYTDTLTISSTGVTHLPLRVPVRVDIVPWLNVGVNPAYDFSDILRTGADSLLTVGYTLGASENTGWTFNSPDSGRNWSAAFSRDPALFSDGEHTSGGIDWIVGDSALMLFRPGGSPDWLQVHPADLPIDSTVDLRAISFADATRGWAVGGKGAILRSVDGGATWQKDVSGTTLFLTDVVAPSTASIWVAGNAGTILHSTDGASWSREPTGTTIDLWAIAALSADSVIAVGNSGTCLITTDGGAHWQTVATGTTQALLGIGIGQGSVRIVGRNGTILQTASFGGSFVTEPSGVTTALTAILIDNSTVGIIVGEDGTILRTRF